MSSDRWKVVALRRNGGRIILDEYLTFAEAVRLRNALLSLASFPDVLLESETSAHASPLRPRSTRDPQPMLLNG